jgi:hypothetical protein
MTREEAIQEVRAGSGKVFDPTVVGAFLDHLGEFEAVIRSQRVEVRMLPTPDEDDRRWSGGSRYKLKGLRAHPQRAPRSHNAVRYRSDYRTSLDLRDTFAVFSSRLEDIVSYTSLRALSPASRFDRDRSCACER